MHETQVKEFQLFKELLQSLSKTISENPALLAAIIPIIHNPSVPGLLDALGFTAGGARPGSIAASWQTSINPLVERSLLALIQSITSADKALIIGSGMGISAAVFIVVMYIVQNEINRNHDLRQLISLESKKFGNTIVRGAARAGVDINAIIESQRMQSAMRVGKAGWGYLTETMEKARQLQNMEMAMDIYT